jgi:23S rRNA pseudouridine1911/1915/1917 synthase
LRRPRRPGDAPVPAPAGPDAATVRADQAGQRLDQVLAALPGVGSRRRAQQAVETGKVLLDGAPCPVDGAGARLAAGQRVEVRWNQPGSRVNLRQAGRGLDEAGLVILYQDAAVVAVDKPPGLLTDTATHAQRRSRDSLRERLAAWAAAQGGGIFLVHRIDRDTSGVVLAARDPKSAERLKAQFEPHEPERVYRAWLEGIPAPDAGELRDWMRWDPRTRSQVQAHEGEPDAVLASARYQTLRTWAGRAAEVEVRLHTGRRNQIRLHAALRGLPLLGEQQYQPDDHRAALHAPRQALHAARLCVRHPLTDAPLVLEAPLPADLAALSARLDALDQRAAGRRHR